jgi:hypothetical protein
MQEFVADKLPVTGLKARESFGGGYFRNCVGVPDLGGCDAGRQAQWKSGGRSSQNMGYEFHVRLAGVFLILLQLGTCCFICPECASSLRSFPLNRYARLARIQNTTFIEEGFTKLDVA